MRIQLLFIVVFLFRLQATQAACNVQQPANPTDTLPTSVKCVTLNQLIQITQLKTHSASGILNLLQGIDSSWQHKGTDKAEIVFSLKSICRAVLTWKRKEQALILFFFSTPDYNTFNRQIIAGDFQFIREETDPGKLTFKIYKKGKIFVKIVEMYLTSPGNYYSLIIQEERE